MRRSILSLILFLSLVVSYSLPSPCLAVIPPITPEGWQDGRLAFGNGFVFGTFVSPMEEPAYPFNKVNDKICRIWFDYPSPQQCSISLQPCIQDFSHSEAVTLVEGVDSYEYLDSTGIVHMVTDYQYFTVHSYTYGATSWTGTTFAGQKAMVRKITVIPKGNYDLALRTMVSLYPEYTKWVYHADDREDIPPLTYTGSETVTYTPAAKRAIWDYNDSPRNLPFKKLCIGLKETPTSYQFGRNNQQLNTQADYSADNAFRYGVPSFKNNNSVTATSTDWANAAFERRVTGSSAFSITMILAYGDTTGAAQTVFDTVAADSDAYYTASYNAWNSWRASGSQITTGQAEIDKSYKNALVYGKMSQAANGAIVIGGRYQIMCYWIRDMMVGVSCFLDMGFYQDAKLGLDNIRAVNAEWDNQFNCLFSNYHASGLRTNPLIQPGEWTIKMGGPQLEGMGDYLYCMNKYYRCTGDLAFINTNWTKINQVANALMADNEPNHDKYQNGLMYEGGEGGYYANETSHNAQAILGFRAAYDLSVARAAPVTAWRDKANALEFEFHRQLIDKQNWQWTANTLPSNASITFDDNNSHTGKSSLKITSTGAAVTNIYANSVPINQGENYTARIWSKNEATNSVLYLRYLDSAQNLIYVGGNAQQDWIALTNHTDFTQTTQSFNAPALGNLAYVQAFIQTQSSGAQTTWFDDVTITRTQGSGSINNPGFETGNSYLWDLINANPPRQSNHAAAGYPLYMGTIFPQLDGNQRYIKDLVAEMPSDGDADGWGVWTPPRAMASSIAHDADKAWNYISKLTIKLPFSKAVYEQNDKCMPTAAPVEDLTTWTRLGGWVDDNVLGETNIYTGTTGNDVHKTINMGQSSYVTFILRYWSFPNQGISEFYINGVLKATVDHYRTNPQYVNVNIGTFYVAAGNNTFKFVCAGRTNHTENYVNLARLTMEYPNNIAAYKADTEANGVLPRQAYVLGGYGIKHSESIFANFAGFTNKERNGNQKIEPQIGNAWGSQVITSTDRVRSTAFNLSTSGRGDYPTTFTMDGGNVPSNGLLPANAFNQGTHSMVMNMLTSPPSMPYPVLEDSSAKLLELSLSGNNTVAKVTGIGDQQVRVRTAASGSVATSIFDQNTGGTSCLVMQADASGFLSIPLHCGASTNTLTLTIANGSTCQAAQTPYGGTARAIPGLIQAEDFDNGGETVSYHDIAAGNAGGQYRSTDVDIEACTDTGGGYNVGWIDNGEWLEYTVNVNNTGDYAIKMRVASGGGGGTFHISLGATNTAVKSVAGTGGNQAWTTVIVPGIFLNAGTNQILRVTMDTGGWNLNYVDFAFSGADVVSVDMNSTDVNDGMNRVAVGDGNTVSASIGGHNCRRNTNNAVDYYFYFAVTDGYALNGNKPAADISIDYYDTGTGSLTLQYDSVAGGAYKTGPSVTLANTNTWKQFTFSVLDAYFGNRQNAGADFRIFRGTNITFYIDTVTVFCPGGFPNKGFENGFTAAGGGFNGSVGTGWTAFLYGGVNSDLTFADETGSGNFDTGAHSQKITAAAGKEGGVYNQINTVSGQNYTITVRVKSGSPAAWCFMGINTSGGTDSHESSGTFYPANNNRSTGWTTFSWTGTATGNKITLFLDTYDGVAYWDTATP